MSEQNHYIYEFGPFRLDAQKRLLWREGEIVPLKPKAFDTLLALVGRCGHVVEKDELMRRVWPDTAVEEGNLTFNISSLRKALGDDPRRHEYIVTIPGEGYQFVAGVRATFDELVVHESTSVTVEEEEAADAAVMPGGMPTAELGVGTGALYLNPKSAIGTRRNPESSRRRGALVMAALLLVAVIAALGIYRVYTQRQPKEPAISAVPFSEMSIARITTSGKIKHAAISLDGKYIAHVTENVEGDSLWVSHVAAPTSVRIAGPAATEYVSVTFAPDGDAVYYLTVDRDRGQTELYRVPVLGGPSSMAAQDLGPVGFSADGKEMTFIKKYNDTTRLVIANVDGTNERVLASRREPEYFRMDWNAPAWSPDGKTIACQVRLNDERGQYETVVVVSVADGSLVPLTSERWNYVGQPAWLADGRGLLVTATESATAPAQIWHVATKGGAVTRITNDLNSYYDLSLTADSSRLSAVQTHSVSSIWVASDADAGGARQIASETGWIEEMSWTPDGRILYRSNAGGSAEVWVMNADGSNPKQLTTGARVRRGLAVSPDGRYIFFASNRVGRFHIWRVDADGSNLKQLTDGDSDLYPHCSPDGQWVVYQRGELEQRLWKVPSGGGETVQLTRTRARRPAVSPDGQFIAYHYLDPTVENSRWRIGIVSSDGGQPSQLFDFPPTVAPAGRFVRWSQDSQSIAYANSAGGLVDIWLQPRAGGQPTRLTDFKTEQIIAFDWSRDGRSLAFVRSVQTNDVVLIEPRR